MIEELLYINDILIELPVSKVALTLQVNDIAEIKDRNAHYTNNIKIPKSPNNVAAFKMLGIVDNSTRIPYESVDIKYVVNGIELITKGKGVIKNNNTFFNLVTYDGNISLSELLGDKQMKSLDFSAYNHTLNQLLFTNSLTNTDGYIYALGEFLKDATFDSVITIDLTTPSFYMHTLWDMIFEEKGWTTTGSFLSSADFKSRLISMNNGFDRFTTESKTVIDTNVIAEIVSETYGTTPTTARFLTDTFTALSSLTHTVNITGDVQIEYGTNPNFAFYVNGNLMNTSFIEDAESVNENINIQLNVGDILEVYIQLDSQLDGTERIEFDIYNTNSYYENDLSIEIDFSTIIGGMRQIDFVKDIMQRFGLVFRRTKNENNFEFETTSNILTSKTTAEDWSSKYAGFKDEKYKPNYAQVNYLKYKYNDNPNANTDLTFADGEIVLDNLNLKSTKTLLTSVFKASEISNSGFWKLNHWAIDENEIVINEDGLGMFKKEISGSFFKFRFSFDTVGFATFTGNYPLLNFDSIYYQKEVDNYYSEFEKMISAYKFTTLELNLNLIDINNADFFKLKYFEQLGQYYYLNKIVNYKKGLLTKVELIQLGADIIAALNMTATSTGESVVSSTLSKNLTGEMDGYSAGCSVVSSTLTKTGTVLTSFSTSTTGTTLGSVCSKALDKTRYHDGAGSLPVDTDIVYVDVGGTIVFNGGDLYYRSGTFENIEISSVGVVSNQDNC